MIFFREKARDKRRERGRERERDRERRGEITDRRRETNRSKSEKMIKVLFVLRILIMIAPHNNL